MLQARARSEVRGIIGINYLYDNRRKVENVCIPLLACFVVVGVGVIPFWIGTIIYSYYNFPVNRDNCSNSCFDTVFKGPYESGVAKYKHVYFNCTWTTAKIWTLTVFGVLCIYEVVKRIFRLAVNGRIRMSMLILLVASFHSHLYGWWASWNFMNDDFYDQWNRQLFFSGTEMVVSGIVIMYLDKDRVMVPLHMVLVANISLFHIWASGVDQFVVNVLLQTGKSYQIQRDIALMLSDILHTCMAIYQFKLALPLRESPISVLSSKIYVRTMLGVTTALLLILVCVPHT